MATVTNEWASQFFIPRHLSISLASFRSETRGTSALVNTRARTYPPNSGDRLRISAPRFSSGQDHNPRSTATP